jgi:hypothetical protein
LEGNLAALPQEAPVEVLVAFEDQGLLRAKIEPALDGDEGLVEVTADRARGGASWIYQFVNVARFFQGPSIPSLFTLQPRQIVA